MRNCSMKKLQNSTIRVLQDLKDIIAYCEKNGFRPRLGSPFDLRINSIRQIVRKRTATNSGDVSEFVAGLEKITSFPTFEKAQKKQLHKQKNNRVQVRAQKMVQHYNEIEKIFPNVKILRALLGNDFYKKFLLADVNKLGLKVLADKINEFFDKYKERDEHSRKFTSTRNTEAFFKHAGIGVTDQDIKEIYDVYAKIGIKPSREPSKDGLSVKELGCIYGQLPTEFFSEHFSWIRHLFVRCSPLAQMCQKYVDGDIGGILSMLPQNLIDMYEFQQKNNMLDIPNKDLMDAGRLLFGWAREKRVDDDVKRYAKQYDKIKRIFPKLEVMRLWYGDKYFERFVSQDVDINAIKAISYYLDEEIEKIANEGNESRRNVEMLLKYTGFGVTDIDLQKIQQQDKYRNPSSHKLRISELSCLYNLRMDTVERILKDTLFRIQQKFFPYAVYHVYVEHKSVAEQSTLLDMLNTYLSLSKDKNKQVAEIEMLEAGRALYQMSVFAKQKLK